MAWTIKGIEQASGGKWYCAPQDQGQIVVVEYAYDCMHGSGDAFRRVTDRSEGPNAAPSYAWAPLPEHMDEWPDAWTVPLSGDWTEVSS